MDNMKERSHPGAWVLVVAAVGATTCFPGFAFLILLGGGAESVLFSDWKEKEGRLCSPKQSLRIGLLNGQGLWYSQVQVGHFQECVTTCSSSS